MSICVRIIEKTVYEAGLNAEFRTTHDTETSMITPKPGNDVHFWEPGRRFLNVYKG